MPRRNDPARAAARIRQSSPVQPRLALVLGSGFRGVLAWLEASRELDYAKLPGFPVPTVQGHAGKVVLGRLGPTPLLALSGRVHYYEGYSMDQVTFPIRVLAELGIEAVLLTNAAGGISRRLRTGCFMAIEDHINLMGINPLRGDTGIDRPRFVDLTSAYDPALVRILRNAAEKTGCQLATGVYAAVPGPSYETPAEIRAFSRLGADAVGMSTVPEAIVARQCGLRVAGLSCITNPAAGLSRKILSQEDVLLVGKGAERTATELLRNFVKLYAADR